MKDLITRNYSLPLWADRKKFILVIFLIAFFARIILIFLNHSGNKSIDLCIYRETGQLVNTGVNPYKYSDGVEIRQSLRLDSIAFDSYASGSQETWDYYTSSNLPLSTLYYGAIHLISNGYAIIYRIIFSLFDAILSVFIALVLLKFWNLKPTNLNLILIIGAGALSPALLLWGSVSPEDKGLQTLLMISAVYFAKDKKWILSALLLGCSVAFKGLGVFVYPISLFFVLDEPDNIFKISWIQIRKGLLYSLLFLIFAGVWFIPYLPDVIEMMKGRLMGNLGAEVEPGHGSIWTIVFNNLPDQWTKIKTIFISTITLIWLFAFIIRKVNLSAISLFLLVLFVDIMLLQGSMDRMNIGILVSMTLFCFADIRYAKVLAWYTIFIGWLFYFRLIAAGSLIQERDALFTTGYILLFSAFPIVYLLRKKNLKEETSHEA